MNKNYELLDKDLLQAHKYYRNYCYEAVFYCSYKG